jgi:hypothetical protein
MWGSVVGERAKEGRDNGLSEIWEAEKGGMNEGALEWNGESRDMDTVNATVCQNLWTAGYD